MAAIFQLRRGTTGDKPTLANGEMYVNTTSASLQVGVDTGNEVTLAKLNDENIGSFKLNGLISTSADITASSAYFSGNVAISGNLFLGNNTSDNIAALGVFTTNLVPGTDNTYDIGTNTAKWRVVYANSLSGSLTGSVNGINITTFSESVDSRLDTLESTSTGYGNRLNSLEVRSASVETKFSTLATYTASVETKASTLATYTASIETKNSTLATYTASVETKFSTLQSLTSSNATRLNSLETFTGSQNTKFATLENVTSSILAFTGSENTKSATLASHTGSTITKFTTLENVTSSVLSYTASLKQAISLNGSSLIVLGDLTVLGDTTTLNTSEVLIEDKTLTLASGSLTSVAANGAGLIISGANVSMSWDHNNTRLAFNTNISALGSISSSTIVGLNGASVSVYSTSVDSRLVALEGTGTNSTSRLNNLEARSASVETKLTTLQNVTSSILSFTSSQDTKNSTLATYTGSLNTKFATLENVTSSILSWTSSQDIKNSTLATYTGSVTTRFTTLENVTSSVLAFSASLKTWTGSIHTYTASLETKANTLQTYTASLETKASTLQSYTSSLETKANTLQTYTASLETKFSVLQGVTASLMNATQSFNTWTSSVFEPFSTSVDARLDDLRYDVDLLTPAGLSAAFDALNAFTGTAALTASFNAFTSSTNTKFATLENVTSSILAFTGSENTKNTTLENVTASLIAATSSYETRGRGIISSSAQLIATLPQGVVSGSAQVSGSIFTTISGDIAITTNGVATIQANSIALGVDTTGNYMSDLTQGTGVTISHTPGEGSNATISIGQAVATSSDVRFNSIGVGTAASTVAGEIRAIGDIVAFYSSDERLKENIVPIPNALNKVNEISGNTYDWKQGFEEIHSHTGTDIGVIAQEIEKVLPQAVIDRETGYKAVNYEKIVPLLIEAIKELSAKIDRLENK